MGASAGSAAALERARPVLETIEHVFGALSVAFVQPFELLFRQVLDRRHFVLGAMHGDDQLGELDLQTPSVSRFWVCWMRKTIRKVTIVVEVLITSCQVSL